MPAVSVIMPVYNSEKYLSNAVKSVLDQSYKDIELLLIDDGSGDRSGRICDEFAEKDSRVKVIHKENGGISSARNAGIDAAGGEYIAFIDNDDEYMPDLIKDNYSLAKEYDADVVRFERKRIQTFENGDVKTDLCGVDKITKEGKKLFLKGKELREAFFSVKESGSLAGIWNGIFKRKVLEDNNLRFNTDIKFGGEDVILNLQIFKCAGSYLFNKDAYYIYNRNDSHSTSTKFNFNRIEALLHIAGMEKDIINSIEAVKVQDIKWFELQVNYIIEINTILAHKNCDWSSKKKKDFLSELEEDSVLSNNKSSELIKELFKINKKKAIVGMLFYSKKFMLLHYLINTYFKAKN